MSALRQETSDAIMWQWIGKRTTRVITYNMYALRVKLEWQDGVQCLLVCRRSGHPSVTPALLALAFYNYLVDCLPSQWTIWSVSALLTVLLTCTSQAHMSNKIVLSAFSRCTTDGVKAVVFLLVTRSDRPAFWCHLLHALWRLGF